MNISDAICLDINRLPKEDLQFRKFAELKPEPRVTPNCRSDD